MKFLPIIAVVQLLFVKNCLQAAVEQLEVSVYYESLCPDSIRFINSQLAPAYQKINSSLIVDFVPYGKATHEKVNETWVFQCQHGPNECWGNKAQACGIAEEKRQDKNVDFVDCVMSQPYPANEAAIDICAPKLGLSSGQSLIECAESSKGDELLAKYGNETHAVEPQITFVPTIVFNGKYDYDLQSGALNDFLWTACTLFARKPEACPSEPSPTTAFFLGLF